MATETANTTAVQPALLFMPDISGFTQFVNNTEITHAQSIIQEVLELIIESNRLDLQVGEIEGDAVFFYRIGEPPTQEQLLNQVQIMFTRFHQHLRLYDRQRICPCAACSSAVNLKLKIIAHYGEVAGFSVKQHKKLFGRDVIVIHRLLKNNLDKKEYTLLTTQLMSGSQPSDHLPDWFCPEESSESYDVGEVSFQVSGLEKLREHLPPPDVSNLRLSSKAKTVFTEEAIIKASASEVFGNIFDLSRRPMWMEGVKNIEMITKDHINRIGTQHRCVISEKNNPVMITEYAHIAEDGAELIEMDIKGTAGCRFIVKHLGENETRITIDMLVKRNPVILTIFNLFMKNRMRKKIARSFEKLQELCQPKFIRTEITAESLN